MQPRRLRLGDVVDDYCPRERRLSNHVIVAMVDDTIKQTRCSTCDFEHPFKEGKIPARRTKKDSTPALYKQVLDNVTEGTAPPEAAATPAPAPAPPPVRGVLRPNGAQATPDGGPDEAVTLAVDADRTPPAPLPIAASAPPTTEPADEGPVHRTLIRATLPRQEGDVPARPIPTFTIREAAAAPKFRRFRPKRGPGGRPFGEGFGGGQGGGFKNPQFSAQPGRGHSHNQRSGPPNRGNQPRPGGVQGGRRNNNARRGNKGPR
jgi:hypothetical protein